MLLAYRNLHSKVMLLTILTGAAVHLERSLVRVDVELDAGPLAGERSDGARVAPVQGLSRAAVDDVAVVVASAVEAAVSKELGRGVVGADVLGCGPEVVDGVLLVGQNGAVGNEDVVDTDTLARVGDVESVVESSQVIGVGETVQVPVGLV